VIDALTIVWRSFKDLWEELVLLVILNVLWAASALLVSVPILLFGTDHAIPAVVLSFFLFWLFPIVSGALCFVTNQVAHGVAVGMATFVTGLRRYWLKSILVGLINLLVLGLLFLNIQFYALVMEGDWTYFAVAAWVLVTLYWFIVQIYWFPFILELESEKVFVALRHALMMVMLSPGFSLVMVLILAVLTVLCIALTVPFPLFMASLLLLIINRATLNRLDFVRRKREEQDRAGQ
jgi:uncharacterized membrane protein YesL